MITSASNTRVKKVAALNQKAKERRQEGKYVVEGVKMFLEAPEEEIEEIYAVEGFQNAACMEKLAGRPFETVSEEVFRKMSDTAAPQGILCVMRQKKICACRPSCCKEPASHDSGGYPGSGQSGDHTAHRGGRRNRRRYHEPGNGGYL